MARYAAICTSRASSVVSRGWTLIRRSVPAEHQLIRGPEVEHDHPAIRCNLPLGVVIEQAHLAVPDLQLDLPLLAAECSMGS